MSPLLAYMGLSAPSTPGSSLLKGEGALGLGHTGCAVGITFLYVCPLALQLEPQQPHQTVPPHLAPHEGT